MAKPAAREKRSKAVPSVALQEDGVSLYLHFPYCVAKCRYCDFNSYAHRGQDMEHQVHAILAEAELRAQNLRPQTVFFGGGTPSLLEPALLQKLFNGLHDISQFRDSANEVTMEANPESLDTPTAQAAAEAGVNRISLGFQSFDQEVLRAYDRVHSAEDCFRAFAAARSAGIARINVDLIFAYPGQTLKAWEQTLQQVLSLQPEHISCYELSYEPGTALTRLKEAGRWQAEDVDQCLRLFLHTRQILGDAGYFAYEVSAFAKEQEAARHNLAYWRFLDYVGLGAGASSWHNGKRRRNLALPEEYSQAMLAGNDPVAEEEACRAQTVLFDILMMGLRLPEEGVSVARAKRISGLDLLAEHKSLLQQLIGQGLLELLPSGNDHLLRCTNQGLLLLDNILQRFLPEPPALSV